MTEPTRRSSSPWATRLDDAPDALELPADRPRPSALEPGLEVVTARVEAAVAEQARRMANDVAVDLGAVVLAWWQATLARHVEDRDLVVGCTAPSDGGPGRRAWLIARSSVDLSCTFPELVKRAGESVAEAATSPVTMPELVDALGITPSAAKHPVFQVALHRAGPPPVPDASDLFELGPPCDLVLQWHDGGDGLEVALAYAPQLFDRRRIERLVDRLVVLLRAALDEPDRQVRELDVLPPEEVSLLRSFNQTGHAHDEQATVAELFEQQAARTPDAISVELDGRSLTYRQLDERASALAHVLVERGVEPDVTVAVSMERSIAMVTAVLAVLKAGGAYVPIDPAYPEARRSYMVEQAAARLVLTDGPPAAGSVTAGEAGAEVIDAGEGASERLLAGRPVTPPERRATGEHLGYVIFTSGSTGQPKGVALPQRALTNLIEWQLRRPDFEPGVRTLQFASLSFDVSFQEIFTTWCSGGTLVLVSDRTRRDPRGLLDHVRSQRVGRVFLPFVALRGLADAAAASGTWPSDLREVYTAGEQLVVDDTIRRLFDALPGCLLENQYGPSESHVATAHRLEGDPVRWPTLPPIGGPIDNATAVVLDSHGRLTGVGVPGELHLGGVCLAREYLGRPDLTAERFVERPDAAPGVRLYRTGDLVRWTERGVLEFLGRIDHQVKFRGYRIEPGEVASVLSRFPAVRQCVASVVDLDDVGARLAAYVVPRDGQDVALHELHAFARANLPDYMVPSHYVVLDALPMTPSGKVDTAGLPRPGFDRSILSNPYVAPNTPIQWALAEMWQELLGVEDVGRYDDFFELGGDSLMAVELFLRIGERFGVDLPLGALAQAPTVDGLSQLLEQSDDDDNWDPLVPLKAGGDKTPLFCVHGGSGNIASLPILARALPDDQPVYALQWDGLRGEGGARTIEAMADRYLQDIRRVQPAGPYLLAGQCIGGLVAREMASRLLADGERVGLLVMYESPNLATRHWRPKSGMPPLPAAASPFLRRLIPVVLWLVHLAKARDPRRRMVLTALRDLAGRRVPADDRAYFGARAMARAAWKHTPRPVPVRTLYVHTGLRSAGSIALTGVWVDGMLGWSSSVSDDFRALEVSAGHNAVPYAPAALERLVDELERFHTGTGRATVR